MHDARISRESRLCDKLENVNYMHRRQVVKVQQPGLKCLSLLSFITSTSFTIISVSSSLCDMPHNAERDVALHKQIDRCDNGTLQFFSIFKYLFYNFFNGDHQIIQQRQRQYVGFKHVSVMLSEYIEGTF